MFGEMIREGKPTPDFSGTDDFEVHLLLSGDVQNPQFLKFLERSAAEQQISFTVDDLLVLDSLQRETPIPNELKQALHRLHEIGIVERIGRGRGAKFILSRRFYSFLVNQVRTRDAVDSIAKRTSIFC
jgi:ATP-dependent DNA helicase RecG